MELQYSHTVHFCTLISIQKSKLKYRRSKTIIYISITYIFILNYFTGKGFYTICVTRATVLDTEEIVALKENYWHSYSER